MKLLFSLRCLVSSATLRISKDLILVEEDIIAKAS